jgi:hypothetical protein
MKRTKQIFAMTLAAAIRKNEPTNSQSHALQIAWRIVKKSKQDIAMLTFRKNDGTVCRRVVSENWTKYCPPAGSGKTKPAGMRLFADLAKFLAGNDRCIISTYNVQNLERLAA